MVVGYFPPLNSGIGDYTALLVKELANLVYKITIVTTKVDYRDTERFNEGVNILRVISGWRMSDTKKILEIIDEMGPGTIVHIQYGSPAYKRRPMINLLPLLIRLTRRHCPVVVTLHEFRQQRLRWRIRVLPMLLATQGLIFVDPPDRELLRRWTVLNKPQIDCIPIAPNIPPVPVTRVQRRVWRRDLGLVDDHPVVVFFGGIHPHKGFLDLLKTINNLRLEGLPVRLLVIGGFEPWIKRYAVYHNKVRKALEDGLKAGWITLVDKAPADVVSKCLHASDVAAFPFIQGATANRSSLLAALSHGLPVVTTMGVATPEGFDEQFGVALVPAKDVEALSACLKRVIMSDILKKQMKAKALRVTRDLSWTSISRMTVRFYSLLMARSR